MDEKGTFELPIPEEVRTCERAYELLRVWAAGGSQHIAIDTGMWSDPAAWGIALVDLVRHIANAYELQDGAPRSETLKRVREAFDAEWSNPTSPAEGKLGT